MTTLAADLAGYRAYCAAHPAPLGRHILVDEADAGLPIPPETAHRDRVADQLRRHLAAAREQREQQELPADPEDHITQMARENPAM